MARSSASLLPIGTILFTSRATIGEVAILAEESATNQGFQSLIPKTNLDGNFLFALTYKISHYSRVHASGSTFQEISSSEIKKATIAIPSLQEQKTIGIFFSVLDNLIAAHERKCELLKKKKTYYLQQIFSQQLRFKGFTEPWQQRKLGELLKYERPDRYIVKSEEYSESGIPVLTANKGFILGYTHEKGIYDKGDSIIFDDFTLDHKYVDFPYKVKSSAIKILTAKNPMDDLYFYDDLLSYINSQPLGHVRHYISIVQNHKVNIPDLIERLQITVFLRLFQELQKAEMMRLSILKKQKVAYLQRLLM